MTFALQAQGIRKSFGGVEVLHGVDLDAVGGSVLALLGRERCRQVHARQDHRRRLHRGRRRDRHRRGDAIPSLTPIAARDLGVAIIFQEFQDAPTLTVAENISLGRLPNRFGFVDWRVVRERARKILKELDVDIDPSAARVDAPRRRAPDHRDRARPVAQGSPA